jgi:uncharacterized membrane protein
MGGRIETEHTRIVEVDAVSSPAAIAGHPIHPMLVPLPIGLLSGALAADVLFTWTGDGFFAEMALWLIGGGLVTGVLAALVGLVDFVVLKRPRQLRAGWLHAGGNVLVIVLAAGNFVLRLAGGAEEAVVPWGLTLSVLVGLLLALSGWFGGELSYRYLVGVRPDAERTAASERHFE